MPLFAQGLFVTAMGRSFLKKQFYWLLDFIRPLTARSVFNQAGWIRRWSTTAVVLNLVCGGHVKVGAFFCWYFESDILHSLVTCILLLSSLHAYRLNTACSALPVSHAHAPRHGRYWVHPWLKKYGLAVLCVKGFYASVMESIRTVFLSNPLLINNREKVCGDFHCEQTFKTYQLPHSGTQIENKDIKAWVSCTFWF